jgi:hypothetical protein
LEERVVVQEGGRRRSMTKRQALAKQFANKGAMGDLKAAKMVLELVSHIDDHKTEQLEERQREAEASRERVLRKLDLIRERINARVADLVAEVDKKDKQ